LYFGTINKISWGKFKVYPLLIPCVILTQKAFREIFSISMKALYLEPLATSSIGTLPSVEVYEGYAQM